MSVPHLTQSPMGVACAGCGTAGRLSAAPSPVRHAPVPSAARAEGGAFLAPRGQLFCRLAVSEFDDGDQRRAWYRRRGCWCAVGLGAGGAKSTRAHPRADGRRLAVGVYICTRRGVTDPLMPVTRVRARLTSQPACASGARATGGANRPDRSHVEPAFPFELGDHSHGVRELSVS